MKHKQVDEIFHFLTKLIASIEDRHFEEPPVYGWTYIINCFSFFWILFAILKYGGLLSDMFLLLSSKNLAKSMLYSYSGFNDFDLFVLVSYCKKFDNLCCRSIPIINFALIQNITYSKCRERLIKIIIPLHNLMFYHTAITNNIVNII